MTIETDNGRGFIAAPNVSEKTESEASRVHWIACVFCTCLSFNLNVRSRQTAVSVRHYPFDERKKELLLWQNQHSSVSHNHKSQINTHWTHKTVNGLVNHAGQCTARHNVRFEVNSADGIGTFNFPSFCDVSTRWRRSQQHQRDDAFIIYDFCVFSWHLTFEKALTSAQWTREQQKESLPNKQRVRSIDHSVSIGAKMCLFAGPTMRNEKKSGKWVKQTTDPTWPKTYLVWANYTLKWQNN